MRSTVTNHAPNLNTPAYAKKAIDCENPKKKPNRIPFLIDILWYQKERKMLVCTLKIEFPGYDFDELCIRRF